MVSSVIKKFLSFCAAPSGSRYSLAASANVFVLKFSTTSGAERNCTCDFTEHTIFDVIRLSHIYKDAIYCPSFQIVFTKNTVDDIKAFFERTPFSQEYMSDLLTMPVSFQGFMHANLMNMINNSIKVSEFLSGEPRFSVEPLMYTARLKYTAEQIQTLQNATHPNSEIFASGAIFTTNARFTQDLFKGILNNARRVMTCRDYYGKILTTGYNMLALNAAETTSLWMLGSRNWNVKELGDPDVKVTFGIVPISKYHAESAVLNNNNTVNNIDPKSLTKVYELIKKVTSQARAGPSGASLRRASADERATAALQYHAGTNVARLPRAASSRADAISFASMADSASIRAPSLV